MFERKEDIQRDVDRVYALFLDHDRGDVVTHRAIQAVLNVPIHSPRWAHVLRRVRARIQREREIATWPATTIGYRLLTTREQIQELPIWRLKKAARQSRRAARSVAAIKDASLTAHQKRVRDAQLEALKRATAQARKEADLMKSLLAARQSMPRPRPSAGLALQASP